MVFHHFPMLFPCFSNSHAGRATATKPSRSAPSSATNQSCMLVLNFLGGDDLGEQKHGGKNYDEIDDEINNLITGWGPQDS